MSTTAKKFIMGAISFATVVSFSGFLAIPVAHGQSTTDLQTQINQLLAQIAQLQAQLGQNSGGSMTPSYNYTRDLTVESRGNDVSAMQQVLINKGYLKIAAPTGYFGSMTKSALGAWQAANGISPTAGYFGPKTRAAFGAMAGTPGTPVIPGVPAPASGLSVSLAADNPAAGALISSTGSSATRVPVLKVNLTAGVSGGITVNTLKFRKVGAFSDSNISNAYLVEGGKVIAQYSSLSGGIITFNGLGLGVNAGQTRSVLFAVDPATGLTAGNTVSFAMAAGTDVEAVDSNNTAVTAGGMFPISGSIFTVTSVSNPSLASLTIASSSIGTTVYAGTTNVMVSQWTLTAANSPVKLNSINFKVIGSANKSDLKNIKMLINGAQVGPTLAQANQDGSAYFDLTSAPATVNTGSSNMQVYADVMGSASFTFQFELLNTYDILAIDSQYAVPVSVTVNGGTGVQVTINQGTITVSLASDTPTGTLTKGGSGTALGKFTVYAAGEPVKVKWLGFSLLFGTWGTNSNTLDNEIKNVTLIDDAGNQVGSTITSLLTTVTCTDTVQANVTSTAVANCFGSSGSPINYIVPANTTRVLTLRGDIQSTAGAATIQARLVGNTNNLQGQTSSQSASSGSVNGSTLTIGSSAVTASKNSGIGTQTFAAGASGVKIGSYSLTASTGEGANLNSMTINGGANLGSYQNMKVMIGTTQFGNTQTTVANSTNYTFSGNLNIPSGQTKIVDVVADIISGTTAATHTAPTTFNGCSGSGASTYGSVTCTTGVTGQNVTVAGQATIQISSDLQVVPTSQVVSGATDIGLAAFRFIETSQVEDVKITNLNIFQTSGPTSTVKAGFSILSLYNGSALVGTSGAANTSLSATTSVPGQGYYWPFNFATPIVVPKAGSLLLTLKGNVASFSTSGITDNSAHIFKITTSTSDTAIDTVQEAVVALGSTSNSTSSVTFLSSNTANGNTITMLRTKLSFSASPIGASSARVKSSADNLASITFTADAAGDLAVNSLIVTFSGNGPTGSTFLDNVILLDSGNNTLGSGNTTSSVCTGSNTCTKTFNLGSTSSGLIIPAGQSKTLTLQANTTTGNTATAQANVPQSLNATINARTDIRYTTAIDGTGTSTISLPSNVLVPIILNSTSYVIGT